MPITDPNQEYFKDGGWGWSGSKWAKNGLAFAYGGRVLGSVYEPNADAGINGLNGAVVPADTLWVINTMEVHNNTSAVTYILLGLYHPTTSYWLASSGGHAKQVGFSWSGQVILVAGDWLLAQQGGCTAGDGIGFTWSGYQLRTT